MFYKIFLGISLIGHSLCYKYEAEELKPCPNLHPNASIGIEEVILFVYACFLNNTFFAKFSVLWGGRL